MEVVVDSTEPLAGVTASSDAEILNTLRLGARPGELASRSLWPTLKAIVLDWTVIAISVAAILKCPLWLSPVFLVLIASRQHALLILMHDGAHYLLTQNKRTNDLLSDLFCAFPFLITTSAYRTHHIAHHNHLNTSRDPDLLRKVGPATRSYEWVFPVTLREFGQLLAHELLGGGLLGIFVNARRLARSNRQSGEQGVSSARPAYRASGLIRLAHLGVLSVALAVSGKAGMLLYAWFVPFFFLVPVLLRIRSVAEHFALPKQHILNHSRNVKAPWWERLLLAPHATHLHLDHHLFPYVPWHRMAELHERLERCPEYNGRAHCNSGYLSGEDSLLSDIARVMDDPRKLFHGQPAADHG